MWGARFADETRGWMDGDDDEDAAIQEYSGAGLRRVPTRHRHSTGPA